MWWSSGLFIWGGYGGPPGPKRLAIERLGVKRYFVRHRCCTATRSKGDRASKGSVTCKVALIQSSNSNNPSLETHSVRRITVRYCETSCCHDVVSTKFMVAQIARARTSLTGRHWSSKRCWRKEDLQRASTIDSFDQWWPAESHNLSRSPGNVHNIMHKYLIIISYLLLKETIADLYHKPRIYNNYNSIIT